MPRDQRERIERDRGVADIGDVVLDGEQVTVVDRDGAAEGEAVAIVVFQRHRVARGQIAGAFLLPYRVLVGNLHRRAAACDPAEFRVVGSRRAGRREQHDRRRLRVHGVAELHQRQVVDARAPERNAAAQARGVDLDARLRGNRGLAIDDGCRRLAGGRRIGRWRGRNAGLRGRAVGRGGRLRQLALQLALRALLFHLRDVEEILPAEQYEAGQNDGEDGVAIIGHRSGLVIQFGWRQA